MSTPRQICTPEASARPVIPADSLARAAQYLCEIGREFHHRGWAPGTGGNYSIVLAHSPLQLAITASGVEKGKMIPSHVLVVDEVGEVAKGIGRPSYESLLHIAVVQSRSAGSVLHTHSAWGTILSHRYAAQSGLAIEGFEMLKGLEGVTSHTHREWVPILSNSQDISSLAAAVKRVLHHHPEAHAFLLEGHGLYTWGESPSQAFRHVEVLEFLFEVLGHITFAPASAASSMRLEI
jgi:methylthioribulose-1-phosphate dehydratase